MHRGTAGLSLFQPFWKLRFTVDAEFVGPRSFYEFSESGEAIAAPSHPHALLNARISKQLGEHIELFFGLENLLIVQTETEPVLVGITNASLAGPTSHFPSSPWRIYGGLRLNQSLIRKDNS